MALLAIMMFRMQFAMAAPINAILLDSVPPEVNMISFGWHFRHPEIISFVFLGRVSVEDIENALRDDTFLVSVMYVNNEIGSVQRIGEIGEALHLPQSPVHFLCRNAFRPAALPQKGLGGFSRHP